MTPDSQSPKKNIKTYTNNIVLYRKNNINNKRFHLNICSKVFPPKLCEGVLTQSYKIKRVNEYLNSWMSYQNIFKTLLQYERFKYIQLTWDQFKIFNSMKLFKFENLKPSEDVLFSTTNELDQMLKNQEETFLKRLNDY